MSKKSFYKNTLPSRTYIVKYKGTTSYLGFCVSYIKVKQYSYCFKRTSSSLFTIIFPPIYNTELLKVGEIVNLKSQDFEWDSKGFFMPSLNFKKCRSYSIEEYYSKCHDAGNELMGSHAKGSELIETVKESNITQISYMSWENVLFKNGHMLFASPYSKDGGKGKIISWPDSVPDFEYIKPALQKMFPNIKVKINKFDIVEVFDFEEITSAIINLKKRPSHKSDVVVKKTKLAVTSKPKRMNLSEARSLPEIKSSVYLKELCNIHIKDFPLFYCTETKNTFSGTSSPEKAFVFCLKNTDSYLIIIYENVIESRSSYLFKINRGGFIGTIKKIHDFFSSSMENKREKLSINSIEFPKKVISYTRIIHKSYEQWIGEIRRYCKYI